MRYDNRNCQHGESPSDAEMAKQTKPCIHMLVDELQKFHPTQLLTELRTMRLLVADLLMYGYQAERDLADDYERYIQKLKEVLATKPHVPNKQEAKQIRIAKMKAKRHR